MYKCVIYNEDNKRKILNLDLDSEEDVIKYASENKMKIISIKKIKSVFRRKKLKDKDLRLFSKEVSILLKSGCEISRILEILKNVSSDKIKKVVKIISNNIEKGNSITESFEKTNAFPTFYISMVKAGEVSGRLDDVMERLALYYQKESKLKSKCFSIMIYPSILLLAMVISFLLILVFLVPSFEDIYADNNVKAPLLTKILIFLSHILRDHFMLIILFNIVIISSVIYLKQNNKKINEIINRLKFNFPIIRTYSKLLITNKFSKALSILILSGVQIVESIDISAKVINNEFLYRKICMANDSIKKGNTIGDSLKIVEEFPDLFLSMVIIGEESGRLDSILDTVNEYYEHELDSKLEICTKYFENIAILLIGLFVGVTVISMMLPMFDAVASI